MLARIATLFTFLFFIFPLLASSAVVIRADAPATAASASGGGGGGGGSSTTVSQCNTGKIQCCNSVQSASSKDATDVAGLLNVVLKGITGQVGLTCNPISVIGVGGNSCSAQPVCCTGNSFGSNGLLGSLLVIGCSPINVNL